MGSLTVRIFDTESDGFWQDATRLWCIATRDLDTREERFFGPDEIQEGLDYLSEADVVVAHNSIGHDFPLMKRLYGWEPNKYEDSLILSRLYNPDRDGHSIDDWGRRLGMKKPEHEDWTQFSPEMRHRCIEDTRINARVLRLLIQEGANHDWSASIRTEYDAQWLQNDIEAHGVRLDIATATELADEWEDKLADLHNRVVEQAPPQVKHGTTVKNPWKLNGELNKRVLDWVENPHHVAGPFSKVEFIPFNLNSPKQVTELLLTQGWEPTEYNYKKAARGGYELNPDGSYVISSPKLTDDSLDSIEGDVGTLIVEHRLLKHRLGVLRRVNQKTRVPAGWLNDVREDGRLTAQAIPLGTPTARYTHSNIVNIPSVEAAYGEQLRSLLLPSKGKVFVGTDASGLEARVAGHLAWEYDGGSYARVLLQGDIHSRNAAAFSDAAHKEISRSLAKGIGYALMFGATSRKIASMAGVSADVGQMMIDAFWSVNPGLSAVREKAYKDGKKNGYLVGLDGRKIMVRSPHAALNCIIQSTGAILMKEAFLYVNRGKNPWTPCFHMHDEMTCEMDEEVVALHRAIWKRAGEHLTDKYNLSVPLIFDSAIGLNYAEVH